MPTVEVTPIPAKNRELNQVKLTKRNILSIGKWYAQHPLPRSSLELLPQRTHLSDIELEPKNGEASIRKLERTTSTELEILGLED
tara:strand:- start:17 stop:271 length:255 start_codon:yes stop_codon:yes gene_type:complete